MFAIVAWSTSKVAFPLFVARYFTPSLIIGFALKAALSKVLQHRSLYLFPLDWEVVLKFPERATNNATDFNIMKRFNRFAGLPTILSTDDIIRDYPQFLVVNESSRAWFQKLSDVTRLTSDKLPVAGSVFARL